MRFAPPDRPAPRRAPTQVRVRFPARLTGAKLAPAEAPPRPRPQPAPAPAPVSPPPAQPPAPAGPPPADVDRQLAADRAFIETALAQVRTAIGEYRAEQKAQLKEWQRAAVELAMTISTRMLHERVVSGVFPMEAKVRDMAAQLEGEGPMTVYLNPADLKALEFRLDGEPLLPGREDPRVVPDPGLARGECRVEGKEGMLLSDLMRELHEIRDELLRSLGNART